MLEKIEIGLFSNRRLTNMSVDNIITDEKLYCVLMYRQRPSPPVFLPV